LQEVDERNSYRKSEAEAIDFVNISSDPMDEGFVLIDSKNNRVKIKNPSYILVSNIKIVNKNALPKYFAKIVLSGNSKEVASYFEDLDDILTLMEEVLKDILEELDDLWSLHKDETSQKEFAEKVKHHALCRLLFMVRKGKIENFEGIIRSIRPEFLVQETMKRYITAYTANINKALNWQKNINEKNLKKGA
jgi:hypothetical protein